MAVAKGLFLPTSLPLSNPNPKPLINPNPNLHFPTKPKSPISLPPLKSTPITSQPIQADPVLTTPPSTRVRILSEALPFIQKFRNKTIVVKYGGAAMKSGKRLLYLQKGRSPCKRLPTEEIGRECGDLDMKCLHAEIIIYLTILRKYNVTYARVLVIFAVLAIVLLLLEKSLVTDVVKRAILV